MGSEKSPYREVGLKGGFGPGGTGPAKRKKEKPWKFNGRDAVKTWHDFTMGKITIKDDKSKCRKCGQYQFMADLVCPGYKGKK